jgi:hypothetical protein
MVSDKPGMRPHGGMPHHANAQLSHQLALQLPRFHAEGFGCIQQLAAGIEQLAALGGEGKAGAATLAQAVAQPGFQRGQLVADGGLADIEGGLGSRNATGIDDGTKTLIRRKSRLDRVLSMVLSR